MHGLLSFLLPFSHQPPLGLTAEDDTSQLRAEVKTTLADSAVVVTEDAVTILGATTRDTILAPPTRRHLLQDTVLVVQYEVRKRLLKRFFLEEDGTFRMFFLKE